MVPLFGDQDMLYDCRLLHEVLLVNDMEYFCLSREEQVFMEYFMTDAFQLPLKFLNRVSVKVKLRPS